MQINISFDHTIPERRESLIGDPVKVVDLGEVLELGPGFRRFGILCAGKLRRVPFGWWYQTPPPFQIVCEEVDVGEFVEIVPESLST